MSQGDGTHPAHGGTADRPGQRAPRISRPSQVHPERTHRSCGAGHLQHPGTGACRDRRHPRHGVRHQQPRRIHTHHLQADAVDGRPPDTHPHDTAPEQGRRERKRAYRHGAEQQGRDGAAGGEGQEQQRHQPGVGHAHPGDGLRAVRLPHQ